jgi:hypothetical protein
MVVHSSAWKLLLAAGLAALIVASVLAKAPHRGLGSSDPRRLVLASMALYALGTAAWITGHLRAAAVLYGIGIGASSLGAWLSRIGEGGDDGLYAPATEPSDGPADPGGHPPFDWESLERGLLDYSARSREPVAGR